MRYALILALIVLICGCTFAASGEFDPPDARLDKKVTLEADHVKLEDVVKRLTEMTGVTIKAGSGERDWRVRERQVTVHAKDIPLGKLMKEISRLLGFYLSREGRKDEWSYLYWQDAKSRMLEAELLNAQREAEAQESKAICQAAFDQAEAALKMTPQEALAKRAKDPWLAYLGGTKTGRGFAQLLNAINTQYPVERDLMMRGHSVGFPIDRFPPGLSQAIADATKGGFAGGTEDPREPFAVSVVSATDSDGDTDPQARLLGVSAAALITSDGPAGTDPLLGLSAIMAIFPITDSNHVGSKVVGEMFFSLDQGKSVEDAMEELGQQTNKPEFIAETMAHESPTEKDPPTDPELTREVEVRELSGPLDQSTCQGTESRLVGKAMAELSRAFGRPMLLESFPRLMPVAGFIKTGKQPLYQVLVGLEKAGYTWEKDDDAFRIRPVDWALRRSYQISEKFLMHYRELIDRRGYYTIDDMASIATELTDDQIRIAMASGEELPEIVLSAAGNVNGAYKLLRLYGSLTSRQKQALGLETGLPFEWLSDKQWDLLQAVTGDSLGGVQISDGSISMTVESPVVTKFTIKAQVPDSQEAYTMEYGVDVFDKETVKTRVQEIEKAHG